MLPNFIRNQYFIELRRVLQQLLTNPHFCDHLRHKIKFKNWLFPSLTKLPRVSFYTHIGNLSRNCGCKLQNSLHIPVLTDPEVPSQKILSLKPD